MPPPAKIFLHMTAAPTKEIAMGTKINVFATTPHFNESANTATASPNIMQNVGTRISHIKLFLIANLNWMYPNAFGSHMNE